MSLIPLGFWAASAGGAAGSFDLLETQVLASSAASVTFSGLDAYAADYQHLQIRATTVTNRSGFDDDIVNLQFNGITSGYFYHNLRGQGGSVISFAGTSQSSIRLGSTNTNTSPANSFGGIVIDALDAFETTKNTTFRALSGKTSGSTSGVILGSGSLANTDALTSLTILSGTGANLLTGSRFSLYGIKAGA